MSGGPAKPRRSSVPLIDELRTRYAPTGAAVNRARGCQVAHFPEGAEAAAAFAELGELAVSAQPLVDILGRTVELARSVLSVPVEVSVTVIAGDDAKTPAATADVAVTLDAAQYASGHGPCLAAAQAGEVVVISDVAGDGRWPEYAAAAAEAGIRSSLSVPLPVQRQVIGALNVYSPEIQAFDEARVELAERFGTYAAVAIGNTTLYTTTAQLAAQMQEAMTSRAVIEQAKGVVMHMNTCGPDEAFEILVAASQRSHRKLRDVAQALVDQVSRG